MINNHYHDRYYFSQDGLHLYTRDYPAAADAKVLLCMHGLTRNSADFEGFANHFAGRYRMIIPDQRGRGKSEYDPTPSNYQLTTYVQDMLTLLDRLEIPTVSLVGTSMGGLMSMFLGATEPSRITSIVLNDIGPEIDPNGLARIQQYVVKSTDFENWQQAEQLIQTNNRNAFPDFTHQQWIDFTRRLYKSEEGKIITRYDHAIAEPLKQPGAVPELWPLYELLTAIPTLIIRGDRSDILSKETTRQMAERHPKATVVNIPNRGHAPILDEPIAIRAIEAFLEQP